MNFQLNNPEGAQWRAYLTNDMDFELAGITQGSTRDSFDNPIVIRPVREFDSDNITTELYILISNVTSEEEWDLNRDESTGLGHRYVIKYER